MGKEVATYPDGLWDGLSKNPERKSLADNIDPDYRDWDRLVAEVIAIQTTSPGDASHVAMLARLDQLEADVDALQAYNTGFLQSYNIHLLAHQSTSARIDALEATVNAELALAANSTRSSVNATTTNDTTLLAANASRKGVQIYNDSTDVTWFIAYGDNATPTNFSFALGPGETQEDKLYSGIITGVADAAVGGVLRITEFT